MARNCEFSTAQDLKEQGYEGIGMICDTENGVLTSLFSDDVRLVKGTLINGSDKFEFFVMIK